MVDAKCHLYMAHNSCLLYQQITHMRLCFTFDPQIYIHQPISPSPQIFVSLNYNREKVFIKYINKNFTVQKSSQLFNFKLYLSLLW